MYTINIDEIEEGSIHEMEIVVAGKRRISLSLSKESTAIQVPGGLKDTSIANSSSVSFYGLSDNFD